MKKKKKSFQRSLATYLSKLKNVPSNVHISISDRPAAAASRLLSSCKYPQTPSFRTTADPNRVNNSASLSTIDQYLHDHFHSLYIDDPSPSASPRYDKQRFFVSPATSNSITEEEAPSSSDTRDNVPGKGVPVTMFSNSPYDDFRRSMQEMVDARPEDVRHKLDWDFMEDLLDWYLKSNERSVHKHILRAFVDLSDGFRMKEELEGSKCIPAKSRRRRRAKVDEVDGLRHSPTIPGES